MNRFYRHIWSKTLGQAIVVPECAGGGAGRKAGRRRGGSLVALALILATAPGSGAIADTAWTNAGGDGDWHNAANWSNGVPSNTGNDAYITGPGTAIISQAASGENWTWVGYGGGNSGAISVGDGGSLTAGCCFYLGANGGTGTMTVSGTGTVTAPSIFMVGDYGSTGHLTIENGGTVNSGYATYVGRYNGSSGYATVTGENSLWSVSGTLLLAGETTGSLSAYGSVTLADSGVLRVNGGSGTVIVGNAADSIAFLNIGAAEADAAVAAGTVEAGNIIFGAGNSTLVFNHTDTGYIFSTPISGNGEVRQLAGTTILTGANTYSGNTVVEGGILRAGSALGLSGNSGYEINGGTLDLNPDFNLTMSSLSGTGGTVDLGGSATLTVDQDNDTSFYGTIAGGGSLVKLGQGVLALLGINSYSGGTILDGGTLRLEHDNALGTGDLTILGSTLGYANGVDIANEIDLQNDATLNVTAGTATQSGAIGETGGSYGIAKTGFGTLTLTGTNTYTGGTTIAGGSLVGNSASLAGDIEMAAPGAELHFDQSTNGSFAGTIGGGMGYVAKIGAGVLLFEDSDIDVNFFHASGGTTVFDGGTIAVETLYSGFVDDAGHAAEAADLRIEGGAQVTSDGGFLGGGDADFGATVEVSGAGTKWSVGTELAPGTFDIRGRGDADLRIENGGVVEVFGGVVISSEGAGKTAALTVDGAGSAFLSSTDIDLGSIVDGDGRIAVSNGGVVRVAGGAGAILAAQHEDTASVEIVIGATEGEAAIGAGTLDVASVDFGGVDAGNGSLVFNHTALDYIFAPVVSGFGTIQHLAGITSLAANSFSFEGTALISGGTLFVDDTLGGNIQVSGGGRLGGSGTVGTTALGAGAIFAPGNSIGTLNVSGDLLFGSLSIYEVELDDGGNAPGVNNDFIDVAGALTIDSGASVSVRPENGTDDGSTYTPGLVYTILSAANGITGAFDAVTASFAFLTPSLDYDANNVYLTLDIVADFQDVAQTPNQQGVANTVQTFGPGNTLYDGLLGLTEDQARSAFNSLSGEAHASASTSPLPGMQQIRQQILDRLARIFGGGFGGFGSAAAKQAPAAGDAPVPGHAVWGQLFGSWGKTDGNAVSAAIDRDSYGFIGGADREIAPGVHAGVALGYSRSTWDVSARSSSGDSDNLHIAGYAGTALGAVDLKGVVSYAYGRADTDRTVIVGVLTNELSASYATHTFQAGIEAGYDLDMGPVVLTPFAGLAGVHVETEGFTETGGPAALTFASTGNTTGVTTLGLRARHQAGSVGMTGSLAWRHAFGDVEPTSRAAFASSPAATFAVRGAPLVRDALAVEAGFEARIDRAATLSFGYSGEYSSDTRDHALMAELRVEF